MPLYLKDFFKNSLLVLGSVRSVAAYFGGDNSFDLFPSFRRNVEGQAQCGHLVFYNTDLAPDRLFSSVSQESMLRRPTE